MSCTHKLRGGRGKSGIFYRLWAARGGDGVNCAEGTPFLASENKMSPKK